VLNGDLRRLGLLLGAAFILGIPFGVAGWTLFAAALFFIFGQQREFKELERWSQHPLTRPQQQRESWQDIASTLFRSLSNSRGRTHAALRQLEDMRTLSEALPDAAVVLDGNGNIERHNQAAERLLKLTTADRGANLAALIRQPDFIALLRGQLGEELIEFSSPFEEATRLEARRIRFPDERVLVLVRDVTQLNRLLSMRQDFIANVSHELRTPLTVIVGYIETLTNEDLDPDPVRDLVQKLASPSKRMQALVDDLLLLTRLEASPNPTEAELIAVNMNSLIESVVVDAQALSQGKHEFRLDLDCESAVLGIESELHSTCSNLVSNAVRYSPDGGVIEVSWNAIGDRARFSVSDQGIGIPPEHLSRLTERFYRVDLAKARTRGGTGLGLAIVKHVLKRHNSFLEVESELARGSRFYFDIPAQQLNGDTAPLREAHKHWSKEKP
tara:strand:+ start:17153 stop:18481 length:1329 start_codon:yes stop_codon:yes gene_type:complete